MTRRCIPLLASVTATLAGVGTPEAAHARSVTLVFDAVYRHAKIVDVAPAGDSVGDKQVVSGILRDAAGNRVGRFHFSCVYVKIVAGDAHERCTGAGGSGDGSIRFNGPGVKSDVDHSWTFTGTSGPLTGANGRGRVHDATPNDSVVTMQFSLRAGVRLPDGVVPRSSANSAFVGGATRACNRARREFSSRPPFPLSNVDPLHPTAAQLRTVGQFFSGPGDARPIEHRLLHALAGLGRPTVGARLWSGFIAAVNRVLANQTRQTTTALAADIPGFIAAVHAGDPLAEAQSVAVRAFGSPSCDLT